MLTTKQPDSLVKFADVDAAYAILSKSKLRWSAPCLFNGPFELDHSSTINFDIRMLLAACVKSTLNLIFSREDPRGTNPLHKAIRRWRKENRFDSEDEAKEVLANLLKTMVNNQEEVLGEACDDWQTYASESRLLCLSEDHQNIALWERFADNHHGIAIRFNLGADHSLNNAHPVVYSNRRPEVSSLDDQIDVIINQVQLVIQDSFQQKLLQKPSHLREEKEWRVFSTTKTENNATQEQYYDDFHFDDVDINAVYLGVKLDPSERHELIQLLRACYPQARLYQAEAMNNRFELKFNNLDREEDALAEAAEEEIDEQSDASSAQATAEIMQEASAQENYVSAAG